MTNRPALAGGEPDNPGVVLTLTVCNPQVEKTVWDWELMNDIKPIWQRQAKEVEEEEYKAFYKTFSKVCAEPPPPL